MLSKLFWSFFQVGLFSIGGGYAALPLIQEQVVDINHWLTLSEFADVVTISQMTPGPISINSATFVGTRMAGLPGAIIATLGCVSPSFIIVITLAYFYMKYKNLTIIKSILSVLRPTIIALIASAAVSIILMTFWGGNNPSLQDLDVVAFLIFASSLFVLQKFKPSPVKVMLAGGIFSIAISLVL